MGAKAQKLGTEWQARKLGSDAGGGRWAAE